MDIQLASFQNNNNNNNVDVTVTELKDSSGDPIVKVGATLNMKYIVQRFLQGVRFPFYNMK